MNRDDAVKLLISIAADDLHKVESGFNQGAWLKKLWLATNLGLDGYANKYPYCAAGMCYALQQFLMRLRDAGELKNTMGMSWTDADRWRCKEAGAWSWMDWALAKKVPMFSDSMIPKAGDFLVFDIHHIGLCTSSGGGGRSKTIEYNTNSDGSREGDGCWEKVRANSFVQKVIRVIPE